MVKSIEEVANRRYQEHRERKDKEIQKHKERIAPWRQRAEQRAEDVATITPGVQPVAYEPTSKENFQEVSTIILRIVECWPVELQQKFHRMYQKQRYHM